MIGSGTFPTSYVGGDTSDTETWMKVVVTNVGTRTLTVTNPVVLGGTRSIRDYRRNPFRNDESAVGAAEGISAKEINRRIAEGGGGGGASVTDNGDNTFTVA
jgi:hypothetical protein